MKQKIALAILISIVVSVVPSLVWAQALEPGFDPNKLIDDRVFSDTQTFGGAAGIQLFLESKASVLANTTPAFLAMLKEPDQALLKQGLEDPEPNLGRLRSAAELIWDAAQTAGINPQVILVTLNKEQSLITGRQNSTPDQLQRALDFAMGFDCPDASGCGNLFPGFYYQLFGNFDSTGNRYLGATKSLMKSFTTTGGRGPAVNGAPAKVGDTITLDNTLGGYDGVTPQQTIIINNLATAALYRYTPHVFNGNYNFWKFFNEWFRYANGTLIKVANESNTYIIQNGTRQLVPAFVAQVRGLNLAGILTVSPTEIASYPIDKVYGPADNTIVKVSPSDQLYVFIGNVKHPASAFVIQQRGLNPDSAISISDADANVFDKGSQLTPKDGTVLRGQADQAVYLVDNGTLKLFSPYTFAQRKAAKSLQTVPDNEIASYPKQGFVPPLDGTIIKGSSDQTVYLIDAGLKRPLSAALFKNRGITAKQVVVLSDGEVGGLVIGAFATPKDKTFFKVSGGSEYEFKDGTKHAISAYVAKQRSISPDYTFSADEALTWQDGIAIPPRDATLVKGDASGTVYLVSAGQLRPLTATAFKNRKYSFSKIVVLSQSEVDSYAKGDVFAK